MQTRSILGVYFTHLHFSKIRYHAVCLNFQRTKITTVYNRRHLIQPFA